MVVRRPRARTLPPTPRRPALGAKARAGRRLQTEKQTLSDWQRYTGLSFLLQMFSFREGNVGLRGSQ